MNKQLDTDSVSTPARLLTRIKTHFSFTEFTDPCPLQKNFDKKIHLCGLSYPWKTNIFYVNPPYSKAKKFILYACDQHLKHKTSIVMLVKTTILGTKYFEKVAPYCSITIIPGRVQFPTFDRPARFGNIVLAFGFHPAKTFDVLI